MSRNRQIKMLSCTLDGRFRFPFRCAHGVICQAALCCNSERNYCLSTIPLLGRHFAAHHHDPSPSRSQPWMDGLRPIFAVAIRTLTTQWKPVYLYSSYTAGTYRTRTSTPSQKSIHLPIPLCSLALSAAAHGSFFSSCPGAFSFTPTRLLLPLYLLPANSSLFPLSLNMQIRFLNFLVSRAT